MEIELTDTMIDAGLAAYADHDTRFERDSSLVISIFKAMISAYKPPKRGHVDPPILNGMVF